MVLVSRRTWSLLTTLGALGLVAVSCGPKKNAQTSPIGISRFDEDETPDEQGQGGESGESGESGEGRVTPPASGGTTNQPPKSIAFVLPDPAVEAAKRDAAAAEKEAEFARQLLRDVATPEGSAGLVFVLGQRASDLPWTLAIENRSAVPLSVAGDPLLLSFEVVPEPAPVVEAIAPTTPGKTIAKPKVTPVPKPVICGPAQAPKSVADDAWLELGPGDVLTYNFDPRALCADPGTLKNGVKIAARYGFTPETKKVWTKGKAREEVLLDKAPFVSRPKEQLPQTPLPPKLLVAPLFELDETYPLEAVHAQADVPETGSDPSAPLDPNAPVDPDAPARAGSTPPSGQRPLPELTLSVSPLGSADEVDETTVTFTLKNQGKKGRMLFLRRELVVYELLGPRGSSTCRMYPSARAPDAASFETLGAGGSRTLTTRLAEACPPTTFSAPGTYAVSARFEARDDGSAHGFSAFTGDVSTERPARFVVRGDKKEAHSTGFHVSTKP